MPKKIRDLKAMLRQAGWVMISGGKGSHSKWMHATVLERLTVSGKDGDDAKRYQEKFVAEAIEAAKNK